MPPRYYLDTSVFGGVFDEGFDIDSLRIFEMVNAGEIICVISDVTEIELVNAPEQVRSFFLGLDPAHVEQAISTNESFSLAQAYLANQVVGATSESDCHHIAIATVYEADLLISWNFKHIVNTQRVRGYNSVNLCLGYKELDIISPKALLDYENERKKRRKN